MMKLLILTFVLAIPPASAKVKPPTAEELVRLKDTVKNLEGTIAEHQERLTIHKAEIDNLRKQLHALESRLESRIVEGKVERR